MTESVAERYLRLGLQVGRHADGVVDAYFGPPELAASRPHRRSSRERSSPAPRISSTSWRTAGCATRLSACAPTSACWRASPAPMPTRRRAAPRRAADLHRRSRVHGRTRAPRGAASRRRLAGGAVRAWEDSIRVAPERVERKHASVVEGARDARPGRAARRRGRRPGDRADKPGGRPATTSATSAAGSPSTSTCRCRPWSCSCWRSTRRPRTPHGALLQGAPARAWPRAARGDARAADAAVAIAVLRRHDARARRRGGARGGHARRRHRARPRPRARRQRALEPCRWARSMRR